MSSTSPQPPVNVSGSLFTKYYLTKYYLSCNIENIRNIKQPQPPGDVSESFFLQNIREKSIKLISQDLFSFIFFEVPLCLLEAGGPVVVPSFIEVSEMRKYLPMCGYLE